MLKKSLLKTIMITSFMLYLIALVYILFFMSRNRWVVLNLTDYIKYSSNLIPFKSISFYIEAFFNSGINIDTVIKNLFGNLILFLPMGIYLPYFFKKTEKVWLYLLCITLLLFIVEFVQIMTRRGVFDIDDFILNITGALLGFFIWKMINHKKKAKAGIPVGGNPV